MNTQRYKIWVDDDEYEFIDYTEGTQFVGLPLEYLENTTYDGGKTFEEEEGHLLFQISFYMSD